MWHIEFIGGTWDRVVLPINDKIIFSATSNNDLSIYMPEELKGKPDLSFIVEDDKVKLEINNKIKKIKPNVIYQKCNLDFFVYKLDFRKPNVMTYQLRKWSLMILLILAFLLSSIFLGLYQVYKIQDNKINAFFAEVGSGYFKDNQFFLASNENLDVIPEVLRNKIRVITLDDTQSLSQFNVDVVSSFTQQPISFMVNHGLDKDQVVVDTDERRSYIMTQFGKVGIKFIKKESEWLVSDINLASSAIASSKLNLNSVKLRQMDNNAKIITDHEFKYSIFYSSSSESYIYDQTNRYWKGSVVPGLGKIKEINSDNIIFDDNGYELIYLIK